MMDNVCVTLSSKVRPGISSRSDFKLIPSKTALLIVDVQEYLSSPSLDSREPQAKHSPHFISTLPKTIENIGNLLHFFRNNRPEPGIHQTDLRSGCEVIFTFLQALTDDCRDVSLDYKLSGPKLAQLPGPSNPAKFLTGQVEPVKNDILIPKTSCSVFQSSNLDYVLRNLQVEQIIICGQLTDQCVESAVRDAADLGYFVTVVEDACVANSAANHEQGLSGMKGFSRILSTKNILLELEREINHIMPKDSYNNSQERTLKSETENPTLTMTNEDTDVLQSFQPITTKEWREVMAHRNIRQDEAFLHILKIAGVEFLRFTTIDVVNSIRCKSVPIQRLEYQLSIDSQIPAEEVKFGLFDNKVSIAEVCLAGLPSYADSMVPGTKLDAKNVLVIKPDLATLRILPFGASKSAILLGTMHNQLNGELSPLCTRGLLSRVIQGAKNNFGIGINVGAEIEFCLFQDKLQNDGTPLPVDSSLFANATTLDEQELFVSQLISQMYKININIELVHAESASGQLEVVIPYENDPMRLADNVVLAREVIRSCAKMHKMRAVFLPKIFSMQAGNGLHLHLSLADLNAPPTDPNHKNAFPNHNADPGSISPIGESFLEGILEHLSALTSITMPTCNSFRRVGPGCWTGSDIRWEVEDKESPLRVCLDYSSNAATNVELKLCDSTANIYLVLASVLAAGMDGIHRNLKLRPSAQNEPSDNENNTSLKTYLPTSFEESLECLSNDKFMLNVLGEELHTAYTATKKAELKKYQEMTLEEELLIAFQNA